MKQVRNAYLYSSFLLLITLITALITNQPVYAYQVNPGTATPAPTKTTVIDAASTSSPEPTSTEEPVVTTGETRTYTQRDLTVITGNVQRPNGLLWHNDHLYVVCTGDWTIYEIEDLTGTTETYIYGVRNGHSLYAETDAQDQLSLWVPDSSLGQLLLVNPVRAPQPIASNLNNPWGISYLDANYFLITGQNDGVIYRVSRSGNVETVGEGLRSPTGIVVHENTGFVANSGSARRAIEWFDASALASDNPTMVEAKPLVSGLQNTTGITMGSDNRLYFAYALGTRGVVGRIDPQKCMEQGGCSNDEVEIIVYTELAAPLAGLSITPDMTLFVHTMFRPEIYRVQLEN